MFRTGSGKGSELEKKAGKNAKHLKKQGRDKAKKHPKTPPFIECNPDVNMEIPPVNIPPAYMQTANEIIFGG